MEEYLHNQYDVEDSTMDWYEDNSFINYFDLTSSSMDEDSDSSFDSQSEEEMEETHKTASPLPYMLFVYQKEMRRLKTNKMEHFKWKLKLTSQMLAYSEDHIAEYGKQELMNIQRQIYFTYDLQGELDSMEVMLKCRELEDGLDKLGFEL